MARQRQRGSAVLAAPLIVLALVGCTTEVSGKAVSVSASGEGASGSKGRVVQLGDLDAPKTAQQVGAPFDPCNPKIWQSIKKPLRPTDGDSEPYYLPPDDPDPEGPPVVTCVFKNGGAVKFGPNGESTQRSGFLGIYVAWGKKLGKLPKGKSAKFAGKSGRIFRTKSGVDFNKKGEPVKFAPRCDARVKLPKGTAGVNVVNHRFTKRDVCAITKSVTSYVVKLAAK